MDEAALIGAVVRWCSPEFAASVRDTGIRHVEGSHADVAAMRTIYERRRRRAGEDLAMVAQIEGVLRSLESTQGSDIMMLHFVASDGNEGIVLADPDGVPLFAFAISRGAR